MSPQNREVDERHGFPGALRARRGVGAHVGALDAAR